MKKPSSARLNLKEKRATTNATQHDRNSVRMTAGTVMMNEFQKWMPKSACCHAVT